MVLLSSRYSLLLFLWNGAGPFPENSGNLDEYDFNVSDLVAQGVQAAGQGFAQRAKFSEGTTG